MTLNTRCYNLGMVAATPLFRQPFEGFLKQVVALYPVESHMMLGEADVSPESAAAARHPDAWAFKLFPADEIIDHREFERGVLGLRHLYDVITGNRKNMPTISDASFNRLRVWLDDLLDDKDMLQPIIWTTVFNDLGKLKVCQDRYMELTGISNADHDDVLAFLLKHERTRFPGFAKLSESFDYEVQAFVQDAVIAGFECGFNLAQAVQLECPVASWDGFLNLKTFAKNLFLVHAVFDFFGVTGAVDPQRAKPFILNDNNVDAYLGVAEKPDFGSYLMERVNRLGLGVLGDEGVALGRLAGMTRSFSLEEGRKLWDTWSSLPKLTQEILKRELVTTGHRSRQAILPYYAPAVLANAIKRDADKGLGLALQTLARMFFEVRMLFGPTNLPGVFIANLHELASAILSSDCEDKRFRLEPVNGGVMVRLEDFPGADIDTDRDNFVEMLPGGRRAAFVGLGGGSDANQAAQLALAGDFRRACVISVHGATLQSQGGNGELGAERVVENASLVSPGVYRLTPESTSNGRFTVNEVARHLPTYVVLDDNTGANQLAERIRAAFLDFGGVDTIYGVDTGGDALHPAGTTLAASVSTPDQDLRTMQALSLFSAADGIYTIFTAILAVGVDTPDNAGDVLRKAKAKCYGFSKANEREILERYQAWGMDGSATKLVGKTPLVFQQALTTESDGLHLLPIPEKYVMDERNPWNPFVFITKAMKRVYVMDLKDHLHAIGAST